MSNILAIAHKELKSYFASPIAYIVIGFFALLFGYFFFAILHFFVRQSMQMGQFGSGPQAMNINQHADPPAAAERHRSSCCSCCRWSRCGPTRRRSGRARSSCC